MVSRDHLIAGSSPHTRGAHHRVHRDGNRLGIIPAYAGSTTGIYQSSAIMSDHPRIRGEHMMPEATIAAICGSSPHTRGALADCRAEIQEGRIIPAYAGSTRHRDHRTTLRKDHPRIRGEHTSSTAPMDCCRDHPRIRGEHQPPHRRRRQGGGSSPHTRGAPRHSRALGLSGGIIPAYAGSTVVAYTPHNNHWDHPRIRGEHTTVYERTIEAEGSSPHTRGARCLCRRRLPCSRIIPAYAGSTPMSCRPRR